MHTYIHTYMQHMYTHTQIEKEVFCPLMPLLTKASTITYSRRKNQLQLFTFFTFLLALHCVTFLL